MPPSLALLILCLAMIWPGAGWGQNERIDVLQMRDDSVQGKTEMSLSFGLSIDDVFTRHLASTLSCAYHLDDLFALEASWMSAKLPFWMGDQVPGESPAQYQGDWVRWGHLYTGAWDEVHKDTQLNLANADLSMISNYLGLSAQFSPIYGKWTLFGRLLGHADFYLAFGLGAATTEYRNTQRRWVDTGTRVVGHLGAGFRIFLSRLFALRLEIKDLTFAARVQESTSVETKIRNAIFVNLGVSFLVGGEKPVEIWSPY